MSEVSETLTSVWAASLRISYVFHHVINKTRTSAVITLERVKMSTVLHVRHADHPIAVGVRTAVGYELSEWAAGQGVRTETYLL